MAKIPVKKCEGGEINLIAERLNIPLLLATRNSYKHEHSISKYIKSKHKFYNMDCILEKSIETRSKDHTRKLLGQYPESIGPCPSRRLANATRYVSDFRAYHLPPNIYNTSKEPFAGRRGLGGAYWRKLKKEYKIESLEYIKYTPPKRSRDKWKLYNLPKLTERFNLPHNKHKGVFFSNARLRPASTRCMITDPVLVKRLPTEPSPAHYNIERHTIQYNMPKPVPPPINNPHLFLRNSCIPAKLPGIIRRHLSFEPAVGRYEVRFPKHCPCGKKIFTPGLPLIIDREKRKKFRRIPYKKIKSHLYCAPDFTHVIGHGHTYVFRLPGSKLHKPKKLDNSIEKRFSARAAQQFHDYRYINMILAPRRRRLSEFAPYIDLHPQYKFRFNCIVKVTVVRRQLSKGKKLGFGGSAKRFSYVDYHSSIPTPAQVRQNKENLPVERQLQEYPVTRTPMTEIKPRFLEWYTTQKRETRPIYERKGPVKLPPLPEPKLLVTKKDLLPDLKPGVAYRRPVLYNKPIDIQEFFRVSTTADQDSED
ncbi:uncharacterized protein LOC105210663 [Zeugodacus cucurbitae]|uniref:Probable Xaa-Pro aminopeptidase AFLA_084750 n=1 Tax=Zeugodacus cucurbitae TaxID=28588 RepID=A0A0A1X9G0_ZEUCU|nr:uncharacterized protein LOC105210663 [Zeugodacus cucurbitae]